MQFSKCIRKKRITINLVCLQSALKHDSVYVTGADPAPLVALMVLRAAAGTGVGIPASHLGRGGARSGPALLALRTQL